MRQGLCIAPFGGLAEPRALADIASLAEASGWDGVFVWDHLAFVWGVSSADPWIALAAVAATTTRVRIGTAVAAVPRYRPEVLASMLATMDRLSDGRLVFGAGLGGRPDEFSAFGQTADSGERAAMTDEGLEVVRGLLAGERVSHAGPYYVVDGVTIAPGPRQRDVPIWIGGKTRAAVRRAARWHGWIADSVEIDRMTMMPSRLARRVALINEERGTLEDYSVAVMGYSTARDAELVTEYEAAGANWWFETLHEARGSIDELRDRVRAGPAG